MASLFDVSLIIPAYNEVRRIEGTIREAEDYFKSRGKRFEIIVCADGTDGTLEKVASMARNDLALKVLGQAERKGKGFAVRSGVKIAQGDVIGFSDADNKTPITEYDKLEPFLKEGYEVAIGSRRNPHAKIERPQPLYRRLGGKAFGIVMHALVGLKGIQDTQCGFKFFKAHAARRIFERQVIDGYMFDVEILAIAERLGYRIAQAPIRWRDDNDSRLDVIAGNLKNARDILRIAFAKR
jgi:dolichyl-phosphate beta-glucosyltransferase